MDPKAIQRMLTERAALVGEVRAIFDAAETEKRDLSAEDREGAEKRNAAIDSLDARIKDGLDNLERDRKAAEAEARAADLLGAAGTPEGRSVEDTAKAEAAVLRAIARGERRGAEFYPHADETRDLTKGTATAGGNLVPTTLYAQVFETYREVSSVVENGATVVRTASGETINLPRVTSYSAASIVGEASPISESDPAFDLVPLTAYKYAFLVQVSSELVADSQFDLLAFVARQGGVGIGNGINAHFLVGTGSGQPQGVMTGATVGVTGATAGGTSISTDELLSLYHSIPSVYRSRSTWVMDDTTALHVRLKKDSTGQYLWQPGLQAGAPDTLLGRPVVTDSNVVDLGAINRRAVGFGDLRAYYARFAGPLRVERSDEFAFANDLTTFRFIQRADGRLLDTSAFKVLVTAAA